jgi:predicted AAA+ superfamily ATPase
MLNTIQAIIDETPKKYRFFLTGSSARKLRRGSANLLPGRLIMHQLGPLTYSEIGEEFDLQDALIYGTLPGIWAEPDKKTRKEILRSYASTYLKEEVQAEALTKNIEGFSRFLLVAASKSGEFLDFSKLGSQASITQKTSTRFFEILEDTLIVRRLDSFAKSSTRRLIQHPKYYFFDGGVLNGLLGAFSSPIDRQGFLFEHFMVNQIMLLNSLSGEQARLSTYRTESGSEVDLVIEREGELISLEIKSGTKINKNDLLGLNRFAEFHKKKHRSILLYNGTRSYEDGLIEVLPWRQALDEISIFLSK